jgi:hypothetical protein
MVRRLLLAWLGALALSLALIEPAAAIDAPQVDPDSPAGTEYQLPTDRAREEASGGGPSRSGGTTGQAPLFGAGVEPSKSNAAEMPSSGSRAGKPPTSAGEQPDLGTSTPETVRAQAQAPDGGGSGLVAMGGGAAGVLLLGGLAGLALRRRSMRR